MLKFYFLLKWKIVEQHDGGKFNSALELSEHTYDIFKLTEQ